MAPRLEPSFVGAPGSEGRAAAASKSRVGEMITFLIIDDHPLVREALGNAVRLAHPDARILRKLRLFTHNKAVMEIGKIGLQVPRQRQIRINRCKPG